MTIKVLQEIIVDLQRSNNISVILCDHQARDLLACVDTAAIIYNGKVIAHGTPSSLLQNSDARNVILVTHSKLANLIIKNQIFIKKKLNRTTKS